MMTYIVTRTESPDELYHYGVKGMKWGHRKANPYNAQMANARNAYKAKTKQIDSAYTKAGAKYDSLTKGGIVRNKKAEADFERAADKWAQDRKVARAEYKQHKKDITRSNVKAYDKKFEKASSASDAADAKWAQVKEQRKKLGKNAVSRFLASAKNNSAEAKKYNKMYEDASRSSDKADKMWKEAQEAYKNTGRNHVSRIFNNVRYGS